MFKSKEIGVQELSLINNEKESLLDRYKFNKKIFFFGILIGWIVILLIGLFGKDIVKPPLILSAIALTLVQLWVFLSERKGIRNDLRGIEFIIREKKLKSLNVKSERFYQVEELHDLGQYYFFEVGLNRLFFFGGQEFYPTESFPNSHFEIIEGRDKKDKLIIFAVIEKGIKIEPIKIIKNSDYELIFNMPELSHFHNYTEIKNNLNWIDEYLEIHSNND